MLSQHVPQISSPCNAQSSVPLCWTWSPTLRRPPPGPAPAMELDGRQYERIWQHDGRTGGLQMSMADVQALAARASSIHIRLGAEDQNVTLKEGVRWPLEQLALGRTFDRRLDGYAVTEATVAATWVGSAAPAMVTVGGTTAG